MILGLCNTETYDSYRFKNIRRSVQYFYPNGAAPLTGILSLMDEESTNDPEFSHWEKRMAEQTTTTVANAVGGYTTGDGPFTAVTYDNVTESQITDNPFTWTTNSFYRVYVTAATNFRVGHVVKIVTTISGVNKDLTGIVSVVSTASTPDYLTVRANNTVASVPNDVLDIGDEVLVIGTAFAQGSIDVSSEVYGQPIKVTNYTQIFRTPFCMTGTSLKTPLVWDESGPYKDKAKEHSIQHMIEIEKAMLWGKRSLWAGYGVTVGTPVTVLPSSVNAGTNTGLPTYTTGGILWYLQEWEKADSDYRGGTGAAAITADTHDDKRIIENTAGTISEKQYDGYLERVFRVTNNTSNEKLVLCGGGFLQTINQLYRSKTVLNSDLPLTSTYGMNVVKHQTPFGTVYYKTHPLFTQNATLRYCALFLDVKNMKYRPMQGRDTELLKDREPRDADYIKHEYLTEAGFEMWFPESNMFLKNVTDYTL